MRKLIIDGELFQTPAWHRGMGKYSLDLLQALVKHNKKNKTWQSIELILSGLIETEEEVVATLKKVLPGVKITHLDLLPAEINNLVPTEKNRTTIEHYLEKTLPKNTQLDFLILSVLQGGIAPAYPTRVNAHNILLFYDLIPLTFFKIYLSSNRVREEYATHLSGFLRADTHLAISKTVANDLACHTGISPERIFQISGGPIALGHEVEPMDLPKPFILMHTGDDLRKNNRRGILAFEDFNQKHENKYTLVVSSTFTEHEKNELMKLSKNVIFTGRATGEQLNYLYKESEALFYPTEYEGFGLPVLEAMEWNTPVLCSNIPLFREISPTLFEYFDHRDIASMSQSLNRLAEGKVKADPKAYKEILAEYTWEITAQDALKGMLRTNVELAKPTDKLVIFTSNPSQSILGKHVQLLDSELRKFVTPEYRYEGLKTKVEQRINYTSYVTPGSSVVDGRAPLRVVDGQLCLYHLANESMSAKALFTALAHPGVAVLYEDSLARTWEALKNQGLAHATRLKAEKALSARLGDEEAMLASVVNTQKAILVHSESLLKKVENIAKKLGRKDLKLAFVPFPAVELVYPEILPQERTQKMIIQSSHDNLATTDINIIYDSREGLQTLEGEVITDHRLMELFSIAGSLEDKTSGVPAMVNQALAQAFGLNSENLTNAKRHALMKKSRKNHTYIAVAQAVNKLVQEVM